MLPYTSIQEAEAALGHGLTTAETLWFNYSATKSDYFLYCHNLLFLFLIFSIAPLYYIFLKSCSGIRSWLTKSSPKSSFRSRIASIATNQSCAVSFSSWLLSSSSPIPPSRCFSPSLFVNFQSFSLNLTMYGVCNCNLD